MNAVLSVFQKISLKKDQTMGEGSVLMAYILQYFQKFFVLLFV